MTTPNPNPELDALEPGTVWRIFSGIAGVPRPSGKEEKIRAHVLAFARERGIPAREDAAGNILLTVVATPGHEGAPVTVLQGHLDMVCEKNSDKAHDFDHDPIRLIVDRDAETGETVVRADGTTLGADNGIGLALGLAAAVSPEVVHGPLEILCTVDEEVGLNGVQQLAPGFFKGGRLLNLDSEDDDTLTISCAGGADSTLTWEFRTSPLPRETSVFSVRVGGLRGGHSGADIHKNLGNANKLLVHTLRQVEGLRLLEIRGGSKRNAIAREASAVVAVTSEGKQSLLRAAEKVRGHAVEQNGEAECRIEVGDGVGGASGSDGSGALSPEDTRRLLAALIALPHGVIMMEPQIKDLVRTSTNLATLETSYQGGGCRIAAGCLSRSSASIQLHEVLRQIEAVGELSGAEARSGNEYTGWQPNVSSPLLATCRGVYEKLFGSPPQVKGIHAGLECGILAEKAGGLDMVSMGAKITGAHSPDERVYVASVQKIWRYLSGILQELARG